MSLVKSIIDNSNAIGNQVFLGYDEEALKWVENYLKSRDEIVFSYTRNLEDYQIIGKMAREIFYYQNIRGLDKAKEKYIVSYTYGDDTTFRAIDDKQRKIDNEKMDLIIKSLYEFKFAYILAKRLNNYYDLSDFISLLEPTNIAIDSCSYSKYKSAPFPNEILTLLLNKIKLATPREKGKDYRLHFIMNGLNPCKYQKCVNTLLHAGVNSCFVYTPLQELPTKLTIKGEKLSLYDYSETKFSSEAKLVNEQKYEDKSDIALKLSDCTPSNYRYNVLKDIKTYYQTRNVVAYGLTGNDLIKATYEVFNGAEDLIITFDRLSPINAFKINAPAELRSQVYSDYVMYEVVRALTSKLDDEKLNPIYEMLKARVDAMEFRKGDYRELVKHKIPVSTLKKYLASYRLNFVIKRTNEELNSTLFNGFLNDENLNIKLLTSLDNINMFSNLSGFSYLESKELRKKEEPKRELIRKEMKEKEEKIDTQKYFFVPVANFMIKPDKGTIKSGRFIKIPKSEYSFGEKRVEAKDTKPIIVPAHDYYGIEELMKNLSPYALPISKEIINTYFKGATSVKDIFDKVRYNIAKINGVYYQDRLVLMGMEVLKKKAKITRKSPIIKLTDFYKGHDERYKEVTELYSAFMKYILSLLSTKKTSVFLPLTSKGVGGSYDYDGGGNLRLNILNDEERITEILATYMEDKDLKSETPFESVSKKLVFTPAKKRSIVKRGI